MDGSTNTNNSVTNAQENQNTNTQSQTQESKTYTIDEIKAFQEIVGKRSEGVMASVAKSQTGSKEEADNLLAQAKKLDAENNAKKDADLKDITSKYEAALKEVQQLKIQHAIINAGHDVGLDSKTIALFEKNFDITTAFDKDGKISSDVIKTGLETFLNDFPMLRPKKNSNPHVKIGATEEKQEEVDSIQDKINKAFRIR